MSAKAVAQPSPELDKALRILLNGTQWGDAVAQERGQGGGGCPPLPENSQTASGEAPAAPLSADEALAIVASWQRGGMPLFGLHQIAVALDGEIYRLRDEANMLHARAYAAEANVERLRADMATAVAANVNMNRAWSEACDQLAALRAALPGIIGCERSMDVAECNLRPIDWGICCPIRRRMIAAGLLPSAPREAEEPDGHE